MTKEDYIPKPQLNPLTFSDLRAALHAGWQDFRHEPGIGIAISLLFVAGGWLIAWQMNAPGQHWWVFALTLGFPLIGPFAAVGFYEISFRRARGDSLGWGQVLGVVLKQSHGQVPSMAVIMILMFMIWSFMAHMIFGLFLGLSAMTNIMTSYQVLLTPNGLVMLGVGTLAGAALSFVIFCNTVIGLPMVVDKDIDIVTAMIASWQTVLGNFAVMLGWAVLIVVLLALGMATGFLGLIVVLPVLGHATWHLYERAISYTAT